MHNREKTPIRQQADREIATLLSDGRALTIHDFAERYGAHGLSAASARLSVVGLIRGGAFTRETGVPVREIPCYRGQKAFVHADLPLDQTDIELVRQALRARMAPTYANNSI